MTRFSYLLIAALLVGAVGLIGVSRAAQGGCGSCPHDKDKTQDKTQVQAHGDAVVLAVAGSGEMAEKCPVTGAKADCAKSECAEAKCPVTMAAADCGDCPLAAKGDCTDCSACDACPGKRTRLPAMTFRVGEQDFVRYGEAVAAAREQDAAVAFVVGQQAFTDKMEATAALAQETEARIAAIVEAHPEAAAAVEATFASYQVGDKSICCEKMARMAAEKNGQSVQYTIDGQQTSCAVTARLLTAQAQLRAADQAIATAQDDAATEPSAAVEQPAVGS
jgi:hypothetical protein